MSKAVVTDERVEAGAKAYYYACEKINEHDDVDGLTWEVPWEDVRDHYPATYEACIAAAKVVLSAALSHGAEAVEPEQKPVLGYCTDCESSTEIHDGRCGCGSGRVYASPVRSAQEAVKVKPLDLANLLKHAFLAGAGMNMEPGVIQRIPDELNERYMDYDPSELACYERILAALLPPGGETATPDSEHRRTFTVPHGYEPVFDDTGRATGEIRPALSEKQL